MEKALSVCLVLCALVHVFSAAAVKDHQKLLVQKKFSHLQVEIDEWKRLGKPTVAGFSHQDGGSQLGLLIDLPETASIFDPNFDDNVFFYLHTKENPEATKVAPNAKAFSEAGWTPSRPTRFVIHGFTNNIKSPFFTELVPALLANGDANVVGVDWGKLCKAPFYIEARNHVSGVGKVLAKLINALVTDGGLKLADVHILGHSLGAHVAGCTGKQLTSGKIGRISGLDPAMPLFLLLTDDRLNKNDAEIVDVIHTCGGFLGLEEAIGTVDFFPNGGLHPQPGCDADLIGSCSHSRSFAFMAESATEAGAFPANECKTQIDAVVGTCSKQPDGFMGLDLVYNENGTKKYFLETAKSSPYDLATHSRLSGSEEDRKQ